MSLRLMSSIWPLALPAMEKLVFLALADSANEEGVCWPSVAELSRKACVSVRKVQQAVRHLCERGFVSIQPRYKQSNVYQVNSPESWGACPTPEGVSPEDLSAELDTPHEASGAPRSGEAHSGETPSGVDGSGEQKCIARVHTVHPLKTPSPSLLLRSEPSERNRKSAHARPLGVCSSGETYAPQEVSRGNGRGPAEVYGEMLEDWRRDVPEANATAFARWIVHRESQGRPMQSRQRLFQARELSAQGDAESQAQVVDYCIGHGYASLIPIADIRARREGFAKKAMGAPKWVPHD